MPVKRVHVSLIVFLLCCCFYPGYTLGGETSAQEECGTDCRTELYCSREVKEIRGLYPGQQNLHVTCEKEELFKIGTTKVWRLSGHKAFFFEAGMAIDADGAPDTYHPDDIGRDHLANAGHHGNWRAIATHNGRPDSTPIIQGTDGPNPGYYVSVTALFDKTKARVDPRRYVNPNEIPYVVLPLDEHGDARLGDFCVAVNRKNGRLSHAIFADLGPAGQIGEGSTILAETLGINSDPKYGGTSDGVIYIVFPNSGNGNPRPLADINAASERLFEALGGMERVKACFSD